MKTFRHLSLLCAVGLLLCACSDDEESNTSKERTTVQLEVSNIADNGATIEADLATGKAVSARIIENFPVADLTFNYNTEVKLVKFVKENGTDISLPYTSTLQKLKSGRTYISAVIAFNSEGRAVCSAFSVWAAAGEDGLLSNDNNGGDLDDNSWQ